jgi:hypothetical protein
VARKWLSGSFGIGGVQIQHPEETSEGLRIKLIQKDHWKFKQGNFTKFTQLNGGLLNQVEKPSLHNHVNTMGPGGWKPVEHWWMKISCWGKHSSLWLNYFSSLKMVQKTGIYLLYGLTPISIGSSCLLSWHCHAPGTPDKYGFLNIWHPPKLGHRQHCFSHTNEPRTSLSSS